MPPQLTKSEIISRNTLEALAEERLREAQTLLIAGHYCGAIYLAGYSVECHLKSAICITLRWEQLRGTFKTHDLETLLLHSGFDRELRTCREVWPSFTKIHDTWIVEAREGRESIRYRDPTSLQKYDAESFISWVIDPEIGVVPWFRKRIR